MDIINPAGIPPELIQRLALRSGVSDKSILFYLDDRENRTCRDAAARRISADAARGWRPDPKNLMIIEADSDHHAFFCPSVAIQDQQIPERVKKALGAHDSIIYLDPVFLSNTDQVDTVSTLSHECRHAWQFNLSPLIYFGQVVLEYVRDRNSMPAEIDAETFAKKVSVELYGASCVDAYAREKLESCSADQRWFWQRFNDLAVETDTQVLQKTRDALFDAATDLRLAQEKLNLEFPQIPIAASYLADGDRERFLEVTKFRPGIPPPLRVR